MSILEERLPLLETVTLERGGHAPDLMPSWKIENAVTGPYKCSSCGAAKPDATTWPQDCANCGENIWQTTVSFSRDEIEAA